jgi:hypothetical protein
MPPIELRHVDAGNESCFFSSACAVDGISIKVLLRRANNMGIAIERGFRHSQPLNKLLTSLPLC